jgi:hypothetical protein
MMQTKRTGIFCQIVCGLLVAGSPFVAMGQENTLQNFNRVSNVKPLAQTQEAQGIVTERAKVVNPNVMITKKHKVKSIKVGTVPVAPLQNKNYYVATAAKSKKNSAPPAIVTQTALTQNKQPIIPVSNAIWAETKEVAPITKEDNIFSSPAIHLGLAMLIALLGTGGVLRFVFSRSKELKTVHSYNGTNAFMQQNKPVVELPQKITLKLEEPRRKEYVPAAEVEMEASDNEERMVRNDYELSNALQDLKSKQRIHSVVTAKKNVKSKKRIVGTAKKIGTGVGEFELAARLAKMQVRSTSKVMS